MNCDRLALELPLPRLVALEDRFRAGAEGAMVEVDDVRIEEEVLAHAPRVCRPIASLP